MCLDANVSFDLERMPTGERGWAAFLAWATATDDRAERHFLEFKSTIDLNTKADRTKVVRFILGASNRDPVKAAKYFDGRALMVLGLAEGGPGEPVGVPAFEMSELEAEVEKFIGADGPAWDVHRVGLPTGRDVVIVIVDPPTGVITPALKETVGILNGDILLRVDGSTRRATGAEIQRMLARRSATSRQLDVAVTVDARVLVVRVDREALRDYAHRVADGLKASLPEPPSELEQRFAIVTDARSRWQFTTGVSAFRAGAVDMPERGLFGAAGTHGQGARVTVSNDNETFLNGLRVDISFDAGVVAVPWFNQDETELSIFDDRPRRWGEQRLPLLPDLDLDPGAHDGRLYVERESPAVVTMSVNELRPQYSTASEGRDVVLAMFVDRKREIPDSVSCTWKLTAAGFHELLEGRFDLPVDVVDWRSVTQDHPSHGSR